MIDEPKYPPEVKYVQGPHRMAPALKAAWVEALRSGEYKQAKGMLRSFNGYDNSYSLGILPDSHCCLGVLQDVCAKAGIQVRANLGASGKPQNSLLDAKGAELLGLPIDGYIMTRDKDGLATSIAVGQRVLSALNDKGATFAEIADIIERTL